MRAAGAVVVLVLAAGAIVVVLGGGGAGIGVSLEPSATASLVPGGESVIPGAIASPVEGVIVKLDSQGLTKVTGFRLRSPGGTETSFTIGVLENGVEFPPGHLAEHMSTSSPVRVYFRDENGSLVVYRIEDAE